MYVILIIRILMVIVLLALLLIWLCINLLLCHIISDNCYFHLIIAIVLHLLCMALWNRGSYIHCTKEAERLNRMSRSPSHKWSEFRWALLWSLVFLACGAASLFNIIITHLSNLFQKATHWRSVSWWWFASWRNGTWLFNWLWSQYAFTRETNDFKWCLWGWCLRAVRPSGVFWLVSG